MAESSKTHHFIPVIIFPSKVIIIILYIDIITRETSSASRTFLNFKFKVMA